MKSRRIASFTLVSLMLVFCSCGGGSNVTRQPPPPPPSASVLVTPANATVYEGMTAKFQAQVVGQSNQAVTWSVQNGGLGTIDSTGVYTAPRDASGGPSHVVAISQAVPSAQGSATVTVASPQVTISPVSVTLMPGGAQVFTGTALGLSSTTVTWTVQEAGGGAVNGAGFYTAPLTTGFYDVVATSVADPSISASSTVTVTTSAGRFTPTGNMQVARGFHTATLLADGRVLMAGGGVRSGICTVGIASAELYDSATASFIATGSMTAPRYRHTATSLQNGEVLVTGGFGSSIDCEDLGEPAQSSAELYNPSTGSFKATGSMVMARGGHTATLLQNGKVLIAGGGELGGGSKTAELYDPATGVFTATGNMVLSRSGQTATLLANGKVLIAAGADYTDPKSPVITATSELYDPATGTFSPTGRMGTAREGVATLLASGRVLITGGSELLSVEVYDPASGSFSSPGNLERSRASHTATLLPNGVVLVAGGFDNGGDPTAELFEPSTGSFSPTGGMEIARGGHTATLLKNGEVLVAGGRSLATAELYH